MKKNAVAFLVVIVLLVLAGTFYMYRAKGGFFKPAGTGTPFTPPHEPETVVRTVPETGSVPQTMKDILAGAEFRKPLHIAEPGCEAIRQEMKLFFDYLDQRRYAAKYGITSGTEEHFEKTLIRLLKKPPVITGETKDVYILTRNMAHFFRVAKKANILLVKDILASEKDVLEPAMEMVYEWAMQGCPDGTGKAVITLPNLYEYAVYFIETVSGRAYLARRDSRTRMLITYYSVRVLDEANRRKHNRYGFDILPHIDRLLEEMGNYTNLEKRDIYVATLKRIRADIAGHRRR